MSGYPVQPAKVQRPPLRDETLARDRLLDWLHVKIHHRVVFVIAEAGYGKTTLLADFSRRTRLRTLWYRLDDEDRNWIAFLSYLVAAGREHDPEFAPMTAGLLREIDTAGPTMRAVLDTFVREFRALGEQGAVLVLDDFHLVDASPEIREVVRELLVRAPERVTFVIASRRAPALRVARLRALGEIAELNTDDLRFNEVETEQLFRETYGRPLEADVLDDLSRRTEGWAASLQLVQAAIRDRTSSEVRSFVRSITGAEGELYEYLAEEVVGDLPPDLQDFLMRVSVLEAVTLGDAVVASGLDVGATTSLVAAVDNLGLLAKPQRGSQGRRFHPLVHQFLKQRLRREVGEEGVNSLHLAVAAHMRSTDWEGAAYHFAAVGEHSRLRNLLEENLPAIMGRGDYTSAHRYLAMFADRQGLAGLRIVASRVAQQRGDLSLASSHAIEAVATNQSRELAALTLANLLNVRMSEGSVDEAREVANRLLALTESETLRAIATANLAILEASSGPLGPYRLLLERMIDAPEIANYPNYFGITLLNLSDVHRLMGDWSASRATAATAVETLESTSGRIELACAYLNRAWAHAHEGHWELAEPDLRRGLETEVGNWRVELIALAACVTALYHDPIAALQLITEIGSDELPRTLMLPVDLTRARVYAQNGLMDVARQALASAEPVTTTTPAYLSSWYATKSMISASAADETSAVSASKAVDVASRQGAHFWRKYALAVEASVAPAAEFQAALTSLLATDPAYVSMVGELITPRMGDLSEEGAMALTREVELRPERWRPSLRRAVANWQPGHSSRPAQLLDRIGERQDVPLLRALGRRGRKVAAFGTIGRELARRRAERVFVADLGRVAIHSGDTIVAGSGIRRKVLSLLCLLLTQPDGATTRDLVLDALWPDLDPAAALNSLNQTVYFLRRVLEPEYSEETTPGYIHHEGELVWLDPELVDSSSGRCRRILRSLPEARSTSEVEGLSREYSGRFAQDFEYEEWAVPYREWLHASYLETIEQSVRSACEASDFGLAIRLARRALEVDPSADNLEVLLLRAYRQSGAHAAAAEQYGHYAQVHRADLGIDPPPLESL